MPLRDKQVTRFVNQSTNPIPELLALRIGTSLLRLDCSIQSEASRIF